MSRRSNTPFNNPFHQAGAELKRSVKKWRQEQERQERQRREQERQERQRRAAQAAGPQDDEAAFAQAMAGVTPLAAEPRMGAQRSGESAPAPVDSEAEAYARLADLVAGTGPFDIADTIEHVEGVAHGVDRRLLRRLRRGEFSVQAHLDLHGLTRTEARAEVEPFITRSRALGRRCVLVIHGRGHNSPDQQPVLKPALVSWLSRGRLGRQVLAFCTARPTDGGAGALYVLLRK